MAMLFAQMVSEKEQLSLAEPAHQPLCLCFLIYKTGKGRGYSPQEVLTENFWSSCAQPRRMGLGGSRRSTLSLSLSLSLSLCL
jgi:hypothetical protein